jgi:two-component system NtrC family response regulator
VLLDLRMPGMDGLSVLRAMRERGEMPPVAVLTAVPTAANTIEAMRLGAMDHIAKPIGREALAALVARMLPAASAAPTVVADESDELVGATPTVIQASELSQAFTVGSIDSTLTSASTAVATKSWEYAKYFIDLQAVIGRVQLRRQGEFAALRLALARR